LSAKNIKELYYNNATRKGIDKVPTEEELRIFRQILREKERERARLRRDKTRKKKYGVRNTRIEENKSL
jgi:hypothetical protein